jgi:hypothetical protein
VSLSLNGPSCWGCLCLRGHRKQETALSGSGQFSHGLNVKSVNLGLCTLDALCGVCAVHEEVVTDS